MWLNAVGVRNLTRCKETDFFFKFSEEKKVETKKEESEPESDEDMGFGLFD